eukprot:CAMPEP_0202410262 /NCGR_PEP_ID=MMETSP1128-20130828/18727_1 /ASSEMBLY_ACC=CAM_ASM_000463 /TAXON_ID=3047 /ORGANISM="Dunaliella tertiolecta, Strain CCMP1320" /LENGTH=75 /DNA_ID=CAMNT_0049015747 /DNA_START=683 /DNA_END=910 /DNA_ORIENTATION=+
MQRIIRVLVQGNEEDMLIPLKDVLCAIAVVHIVVHNADALQAIHLACSSRSDSYVVKDAEAGALSALRMVTWGPT